MIERFLACAKCRSSSHPFGRTGILTRMTHGGRLRSWAWAAAALAVVALMYAADRWVTLANRKELAEGLLPPGAEVLPGWWDPVRRDIQCRLVASLVVALASALAAGFLFRRVRAETASAL